MSDKSEQELSLDDYFRDIKLVKNEWDGRQVDWLLQWLGAFINDSKVTVGVTLTIGGNQITGTLISHQMYFERLADDFSTPFGAQSPELQQVLHARILAFHSPESAAEEQMPLQYIHLDNARVHAGGNQILPNKGTLWRGKISAVEGFILGEISNPK